MSTIPWLSMEADSGGTLPEVGSAAWVECALAPSAARLRIGAMTITDYVAINDALLESIRAYVARHRSGECGCVESGDAR